MENNDQILDDKARLEIPVELNHQSSGPKKIFNLKVIISVVVALIVVVGVFWYFLSRKSTNNNPTSTNVVLQIKGPEQLTSGNEAEYRVMYLNGENADLVNISLEMFYPSGFKFKSASPVSTSSSGQNFILPILKQGQNGEVVIRGKLTGATNEDKEIKAKLHYRLSNFNSDFLAEKSLHTSILAPNLTMDINGPVNVVNGQDTTFSITFTNITSQEFDNIAVQLTFPDGFTFTSASPAPAKGNNYWTISKLASSSSTNIDITGSFSGNSSEDKLVRADLGQMINNTFATQLSATATFKIIPSSLSLLVSVKPTNYVALGDTINYKLNYLNNGSIGLNNVVITVNLEGPALDYARISAQNAVITGHTLTWKSATLSDLSVFSPNEKGEINFSVPVKSSLSTNLKNQSIIASATISANEISKPTRAPALALKLISGIDLSVTGNYVSGAAPMEVGKPTLFEMTFLLTNLSNDLSDTKVIASLPLPPSAWKNIVIPDSEKNRLTYDSNSGKIIWNIGSLAAFVGKFSPAATVMFQLEVTPGESDRGKIINLLSNIQATAIDTFVNQSIQSATTQTVSTGSINDDVLNTKGTTVQ